MKQNVTETCEKYFFQLQLAVSQRLFVLRNSVHNNTQYIQRGKKEVFSERFFKYLTYS